MEKIKLDELQLKIMKVLWENGDSSVGQIQQILKEEREFAITTISTILQRLYKREIVNYRKEGRQFIYTASISEFDTQSSMTSNLVDQLFDGKSSILVNHLLEADSFESDELEQLKKMIEEAQKRKEKNKKA